MLTGVPLYSIFEEIPYLLNQKRFAVGYGLWALQRKDAREIMGYDSRKRTTKSYEQEKEIFLKLNPIDKPKTDEKRKNSTTQHHYMKN